MSSNNNQRSYRVVIIEPSPIVAEGLCAMLAKNDTFEVVGTLADVSRLEHQLAMLRVDMVIINPTVIDLHQRSNLKTLLPHTIAVALVYSYINKDILRQFAGVIEACDDKQRIEATLLCCVSQTTDNESSDSNEELTEREKEILTAVAKGLMNKEIATLHNISIHTVISHRKNISRKTGIKSVSGFVVYALLNNLLEQDDIHH